MRPNMMVNKHIYMSMMEAKGQNNILLPLMLKPSLTQR